MNSVLFIAMLDSEVKLKKELISERKHIRKFTEILSGFVIEQVLVSFFLFMQMVGWQERHSLFLLAS